MKRPSNAKKTKKTKKKPSKIQSLIDETIAESKSLEQEIAKTITKQKKSKNVAKLDKKVASLSKADQKKYAREVEKTIKEEKKRIRSGSIGDVIGAAMAGTIFVLARVALDYN